MARSADAKEHWKQIAARYLRLAKLAEDHPTLGDNSN